MLQANDLINDQKSAEVLQMLGIRCVQALLLVLVLSHTFSVLLEFWHLCCPYRHLISAMKKNVGKNTIQEIAIEQNRA